MCNKNKPVNVIKMNKVFLKLNFTKLPFQSDKLFTAPPYSKQGKNVFSVCSTELFIVFNEE